MKKIILLKILFLCVSSAISQEQNITNINTDVVLKKGVRIRDSCNAVSNYYFLSHSSHTILIARIGDWYEVELDAKRKWIYESELLIEPGSSTPVDAGHVRIMSEIRAIKDRLSIPFDSSWVEVEIANKSKTLSNLSKDEFETQKEFEKRRASANAEIVQLKKDYAIRLAESKRAYSANITQLQLQLNTLFAQTRSDVTSKFTLGMYDADNNIFNVMLEITPDPYTIRVPREYARTLKSQSTSLLAQGKKQLNANLDWEYFDWEINMSPGPSFRFGERHGSSLKSAEFLTSTLPPSLKAEVSFTEPSGNKILDAEEKGEIVLRITNTGNGSAFGVEAKVNSENSGGITNDQNVYIGEIPAGQTRTGILNLLADKDVKNTKVSYKFIFTEVRGFPPDPIKITIETRATVPPKFVVADLGVREPSGNGKIDNEEVVEITTRIQNIGQGTAKKIKIDFQTGQNVFIAQESPTSFTVKELTPGAYYDASIMAYTNKIASDIPIFVSVSEPSGRYDLKQYRLPLELNARIEQLQEVVVSGSDKPNADIRLSTGLSVDIERDLPTAKAQNRSAVALIIGIRDYASNDIPKVEYAKRDAQLMREYLIKVLGYNPQNILPQNPDELMTFGKMKMLIKQKLPSYLRPDGSSDVFIYYAGHGAPNIASQQPFFVPYDCDPNYVSEDNAYKMVDFYADIAKLKARKKTIVIDACFSGQSGDGKAIVKNASPVLLKVANPLYGSKDAIVFQSSESDQVSNWYPEKKHGMFTYFFLKGLKGEADLNKDGVITVGELERYINDENSNLPYVSQREFQRKQRAVVEGEEDAVVVGK